MSTATRMPDLPSEHARQDHVVPLDTALVRAAIGGMRGGLPVGPATRLARGLARRPWRPAVRGAELSRELFRVLIGISELSPPKHDRRFSDRAWAENPLYRRAVQTHLAVAEKAHQTLMDGDLPRRDVDRLRFVVDNILDAVAPSNSPLSPTSLKEVIDTGGGSWVRGARSLVRDVSSAPRVPSMVDTSAFAVGGNIAVTPGQVVHRAPMFELLQYNAATEEVYEKPVLLVPPTINKYYALDLAPGRSVIEHLVQAGHQVFAISWRNPTARHADWGMDAYIHAILTALQVTREIAESDQASIWGTCSGGILTTMALAHLGATGSLDQVASLALPVTLLDQQVSGATGALMDPRLADMAKQRSRRRGFLDGSSLTEMFAWLRPNDLIWNYWVSNYLLGKTPPAFDLLYWNSDSTRMPAALHADFVDLAAGNRLVEPGAMTAMGVPVDLADVTVDAFVIGAVADHITPWESCYRTTQMLGGACEFVLSNSGHVAAMVNPPGNPKASFRHATETPKDPTEFMEKAESHQGSWWPVYSDWLAARSGSKKPAPTSPGSAQHPAVEPAPGRYVLDK